MGEEEGKHVSLPPRPTTNDSQIWKAYWKACGQSWRTESEIPAQRQQELAQRLTIVPTIEKGIYPFKDVKLNRADVEWLLATHENGRGPVDWNDQSQREREGLDLRGADLVATDLHGLPLARTKGGLHWEEWVAATDEQRDMAAVHLERTNLSKTHFENATLRGAYLVRANLSQAHFEGVLLYRAHLEGADCFNAHLEGASLWETFLGGKKLLAPKRENRWPKQHLPTISPPADLQFATFDHTTHLDHIVLGEEQYSFALLADVRWNGVNLAVIDWAAVKMLGDEYVAHQRTPPQGGNIDQTVRLNEYRAALRANRQLAAALRDQGLNEEADYFAYRAQLLQWTLWRLQRRPLKSLLSFFLYVIAGYGYRPGRCLLWYLVIIIGFALAYHAFGGLSLFPPDAFIYSLTSFHGRGFFPGLEHRTSLHDPLVMLAAFEAVVGLFIEISFIATFTQRFFGR